METKGYFSPHKAQIRAYWGSLMQSTPFRLSSLMSVLVISSHLRLGLAGIVWCMCTCWNIVMFSKWQGWIFQSLKVNLHVTKDQNYSSTLSSAPALDDSGWSTPRPGRFTPRKETRYPLCRRLGGLRAGLEWCGKSRLHRIRFPDCLARSESLYRLRYPG
jgi:hypothetical protein